MNDLTRRQLAAVALGSAAALKSAAQATNPDWLRQSRDSKRAAADILARFEIQMSVEPAFEFKA